MSRAGWESALQSPDPPVVLPALQQRHAAQTCEEAHAADAGSECVLQRLTGTAGFIHRRVSSTLLECVVLKCGTDQEDRPDVEDPVQRLKEAVGRAMPEQIACFHVNCQAYEQLKTSR